MAVFIIEKDWKSASAQLITGHHNSHKLGRDVPLVLTETSSYICLQFMIAFVSQLQLLLQGFKWVTRTFKKSVAQDIKWMKAKSKSKKRRKENQDERK